jgi:type VI secretion system protein ImpA
MSDELQIPPVVDVESILTPIEGESPSGESLRYEGTYDLLIEARRQEDTLNQGAWQTDVKMRDHAEVIRIAVPALQTKTKDLQIGVWLAESLTKEHGLTGLRDSLQILAGLQENFWDTLPPEIEVGDMDARATAITWFDEQVSMAARQAPITGGDGRSYLDQEDAKRFDIPENLEAFDSAEQQRYMDLKTQAENEGRTTAEMWAKSKAATRRVDCERFDHVMDECKAALAELNRVIEEKYDRNQMPGLSAFKKALDDVHDVVKKLLEEKKAEEPRDEDFEQTEETVGEDGQVVVTAGGVATATGAIQSRRDALKRLADVADFFQKTEPHSPVAYLVQRSVKWGNMPLESWLQDVIKDESVLSQIRQTLGFNTASSGDDPAGAPDGGGGDW